MRSTSLAAAIGALFADYRRTWHVTGPAGRLFLSGGLLYVIRAIAFTVAFPLFAKARGFSPGEIGLLVAASSFALFVFGIPVTWLGGRGQARRILTLGPIVAAAGLVILVFAPHGSMALPLLGALLAGVGGTSFWVLGDPLLAETTPATERAHVYALKFFVLTIGSALGGGLGGWIPGLLNATPWFDREAALAATLLVLAALDLSCAAVFSRIPPYEAPRAVRPPSVVAHRRRGSHNWVPWAVMILLAAPELGMALGHNSIRPFLSLFFTERYGMSEAATGTTLATLALIGGVGALITPRVAHRLGNVGAISLLRCIGAATVLGWFVFVGLPPVLLLMLIYYAIMDGTEAIFITEAMSRLPAERRTWFSGIYAMAWSLASSFASFLSGTIQERNGGAFGVAFAVGAAGYLFSVLWMGIVFRRLPDLTGPATTPRATDVALADELATARD